ncbi:hypothetical protein UFOVP821_11 [uncultured Caudovirales phage]|uniref:Uncharacterized protein n=1 Tax=uncultured Caudovirales phage TaxID=2100421 RepID=A0A6J5NZQ8_9CAUD|nr:hypothetical protein UFOVP821_11 [uncultured Caudovirales phage]
MPILVLIVKALICLLLPLAIYTWYWVDSVRIYSEDDD